MDAIKIIIADNQYLTGKGLASSVKDYYPGGLKLQRFQVKMICLHPLKKFIPILSFSILMSLILTVPMKSATFSNNFQLPMS